VKEIRLSEQDVAVLDGWGPHHPWVAADHLDDHPLGRIPAVAEALSSGEIALEIRQPFAVGRTAWRIDAPVSDTVASVWHADGGDEGTTPPVMKARDAQAVLWNSQLDRVLAGEGVPLVPSGITNSVLTEGLSQRLCGNRPVKARVVYRDGSEARPFALRCLPLTTPGAEGLVLRFALMSMRHPEMDTTVDGALLRNRVVSQSRPHAQTDEVVYTQAREKLASLVATAESRTVLLYVYQTGLQPLVMGFYRAVVDLLKAYPGRVTVFPQYWRGANEFDPGTPWAG
jgi:hypothetical protein